jgi:hypothetical protein
MHLRCLESQLIAASVVLVPGMPFYPLPFCTVSGQSIFEFLPQVPVQNFSCTRATLALLFAIRAPSTLVAIA